MAWETKQIRHHRDSDFPLDVIAVAINKGVSLSLDIAIENKIGAFLFPPRAIHGWTKLDAKPFRRDPNLNYLNTTMLVHLYSYWADNGGRSREEIGFSVLQEKGTKYL